MTEVAPQSVVPAQRLLSSFSLEGKVSVVTGGAGGLGWAICKGLGESGADVAIVDLNLEAAQKQADELDQLLRKSDSAIKPVKFTAHKADVSSPESVDSALSSVIKAHGKIDILVAAAGFTENYPATEYPFERVKKLWGVNVDGTYLFAVGVAKHLIERKAFGSMIFIGSMSGSIINFPQKQTPYNASKAAVRHMAASLAVEWATSNIRVNCLSPGYMETPLTKKIFAENPGIKEEWMAKVPQGRLGEPDDIVGAVVFLASDASKYVTGSDLRVDGGYTVL